MPTYSVRVKPGSSRVKVGGAYGDPPALVVAVSAPAVDGRANDAVVQALADALEVRRADIAIVSGHTRRTKVVAVHDAPEGLEERWSALIGSAE